MHGGQFLPCLHWECYCSFKTWASLKSHMTRSHTSYKTTQVNDVLSFKCPCCTLSTITTEREYFEHIGRHLKKHETVTCVFENCHFKTNIYGTFASHRTRKHTPHSLDDFKPELLHRYVNPVNAGNDPADEEDVECGESYDEERKELPNIIEANLAHLFLKLESISNVPKQCIDEMVEELNFISSSASGPIMKGILQSCLEKHKCELDDSVITDMVTELCGSNPISQALRSDGPLSTAYKRNAYYKENFSVVEPVEYVLNYQEHKSFQYVPILKSLSEIFKKKEMQDFLMNSDKKALNTENTETQYTTFYDGTHFKANKLFSENNPAIALNLYVDEFEVCNPLGTSRKKHKITAVYWVLANVPPLLRSSLTSIFLAILCKAEDIKQYGYDAVLEPLLKDLGSLEEDGLYIPSLGRRVKGTVSSVIADNLGAHSIGGFVESFSSSYICRWCLGERAKFQECEVRTGTFPPRTKEGHTVHVQTAQVSGCHSYGVKRPCPLTEKLKHFDVISGYPRICCMIFLKALYQKN